MGGGMMGSLPACLICRAAYHWSDLEPTTARLRIVLRATD